MDLKERKFFCERRHPWELSRRDALLRMIKTMPYGTRFFDIGSGDLFFAEYLKKVTDKQIICIEPSWGKCVLHIDDQLLVLKDFDDLPDTQGECVFLMDVLEHVEDDYTFIRKIELKLKSGSLLIITVPAFQSLFSHHDILLGHFRRYKLKQLRFLFSNTSFRLQESFYFYTSLAVVRWIQLTIEKARPNRASVCQGVGNWPLPESHVLTQLIILVLNIDFYVNRLLAKIGIMLPGLSICTTYRKK